MKRIAAGLARAERRVWRAAGVLLRAPRDPLDDDLAGLGEGAARLGRCALQRGPAAIHQHHHIAPTQPQWGDDVDAWRAVQRAVAQHDLLDRVVDTARLYPPI